MADKQAAILHDLWTPELKAEFKDYVDRFFDQHPELRDTASEKLHEFWSSEEGRKVASGMSEAYHKVEG